MADTTDETDLAALSAAATQLWLRSQSPSCAGSERAAFAGQAELLQAKVEQLARDRIEFGRARRSCRRRSGSTGRSASSGKSCKGWHAWPTSRTPSATSPRRPTNCCSSPARQFPEGGRRPPETA